MRRRGVILMAITVFAIGIIFEFDFESNSKPKSFEHFLSLDADELLALPKKDRPDLADLQNFEMTRNPALGYPTSEKLLSIVKDLRTKRARVDALPNSSGWRERGPNNFGGRTRAILFDPNDPFAKRVWAAGVAGGLWVNEDITDKYGEWYKIDDFFGNLAINSMAYDPSDTDVFYFGTGEGWGNADAVRGNGIWKSVDGGDTWSQLLSTADNSEFRYVQKIGVTSNGTVLAATRESGGIYRSTDGGEVWTKVVDESRGADIEIVGNTIYASTGVSTAGKLWKSEDDGVSWIEITPQTGLNRIEIGTHENHPNTVYVVAAAGSNIGGFYRSFDKGETWEPVVIPSYTNQNCTLSSNDFARGQAWYDLILGVDPTDKRSLIVGGIDLYKTTDAGDTWNLISYWTGSCDVYVHADQHNFAFRPGYPDEAIASTDGGIYYTANYSKPESEGGPDFEPRNTDFNVAQFYACAMLNEKGSNYFLAGAQDNGSHQFFNVGVNSTNEITGGDGAFTFIDQDDPDLQITSYVYNSYYITQDFWDSFENVETNGTSGRFINPADYNSSTNTLFAAGNDNELIRYVIADGQPTNAEEISISIAEERISALIVSDYDNEVVIVGTGSGSVYLLSSVNGTPSATKIDGGAFDQGSYISSVAIGSSNDHIIATASNYGVTSVWETTDGGSTWTSKEGNLPDMPIRWVLPNPNNLEEVLLATELGVWYTDAFSDASPTWEALNGGLANVRCDMLQYRDSDGLVAVATHGRGLYTSDVFATAATAIFDVQPISYEGQEIELEDGSIKGDSYLWDFGDGNTSTSVEPTHTYAAPGTYTISLQLNGDASTEATKEVVVLPKLSSDFQLSSGGDFETNQSYFYPVTIAGTGFELGSSSVAGKSGTNSGDNAWVTGLTEEIYLPNGEAYLYTPLYDFDLSGDYTIEFYTKYQIEDEWEGFVLQYSVDYGRSWQKLGDYIDVDNWYNQSAISSAIAWIPGEAIFSGDTQDEYVKKQISFDDLSGSEVAFRFAFKTDPGTEEAGIAIDDFTITPPASTAVSVSFLSVSSACEGDIITFTNESTGSISAYNWDFGPNAVPSTATGFGPHEVIFSGGGMQTVTLSAETTGGTVTASENISISALPAEIDFDGAVFTLCAGDVFSIQIGSSAVGETYFLYSLDQMEVVGAGVEGTGASIDITSESVVAGLYDFKILAVNAEGCEILSAQNIVVEAEISPTATVTEKSTGVLRSSSGDAYQWYFNGDPIEGATSVELVVTEPGTYNVEVTIGNCSALSEDFEVTSVLSIQDDLRIEIYPNPALEYFEIKSEIRAGELYIFSQNGALMMKGDVGSRFDISSLLPGMYIIQVDSENGIITRKLIKQ